MLAPIALFVFNRLDHASQTIAALKSNDLSADTDLFIFSDGPRNESDEEKVSAVREFLRAVKGFKSVTVYEQPKNIGLAASIIRGVTVLCERFGKVIVVEDDIVTSRHFLKFMNDALNVYEDNPKVMHVSGCTYPVDPDALDPSTTFFLRIPLCWGWATWRRAWDEYKRDLTLGDGFDRSMRRDLDFDGTYPYWHQMKLNRQGKLTTWFIFWYAKVYLLGGVALFPRTSLARNIGHDGSGFNCEASDKYDVRLSASAITVDKLPAVESLRAYAAHKRYFKVLHGGVLRRVVRKFIKYAKLIPWRSSTNVRIGKV